MVKGLFYYISLKKQITTHCGKAWLTGKTYASAEVFNAKIKELRVSLRGVVDKLLNKRL
jgi:hypothetical protein